MTQAEGLLDALCEKPSKIATATATVDRPAWVTGLREGLPGWGCREMGDLDRRFEGLVRDHAKAVYGFLFRYLGSAEDADDALNETLRRAHNGLARFRGDCTERAWMMTIAANVAKRIRAVSGRHRNSRIEEIGKDGSGEEEPASASDPAGEVMNRFEAERLLAALPSERRMAVWMRVGLQMTDEEVAAALGVPVGTVKSWIWRSLVQLRSAVASEAQGP